MINTLLGWWPEFRKSKIGVFGMVVIILMILSAILVPIITTQNPRQMSADIFSPPVKDHLLGTDSYGQDIFSQLFYAGRMSIFIGIFTALITTVIGVSIGLVAGYYGGFIDEILLRIADILMILPRLPLLIILANVLGPGIQNMIVILVAIGWTHSARQIRALTLSIRRYPYIESAKVKGASDTRIIMRHILPNVIGIVISNYTMGVIGVILMESGLSFLGFGDPLRPSWGQMLNLAQNQGAFSWGAWWWWLPPGLMITLLCCGLAFVGMTLNDRFVLRLKTRR